MAAIQATDSQFNLPNLLSSRFSEHHWKRLWHSKRASQQLFVGRSIGCGHDELDSLHSSLSARLTKVKPSLLVPRVIFDLYQK